MLGTWGFSHHFVLGLLVLLVWCLIASTLNRRRARKAGFTRYSDYLRAVP